MSITINKNWMYVDSKNPNIYIGPAFIEKDTSLIQKIAVDIKYLKEDTWIKVDKIIQ